MERREINIRAGELLLGGLFAYAGVIKALDPSAFAGEIANYQLLPWPAAAALALFLPWLEIFCGIAVTTRKLRDGALLLMGALLLLFLGALLSAWFRGLDISCGCFGGESGSITKALAVDLFLSAIAAGLLWNAFCSNSKPAS